MNRFPGVYMALVIFGAVLSTLVLPVPEELTLLGAGYVAHEGALPLWAAWLSATLANVVGDTLSWLIGRSFLDRLLRTRLGRRILPPELHEWGKEFVRRHGFWAIVIGRFLVALRGPVYFAIGAARVQLLRFVAIDSAIALGEAGILVWLGYEYGRSTRLAHKVGWVEVSIAVLLLALLAFPPLFKRRLLRHRRAAA